MYTACKLIIKINQVFFYLFACRGKINLYLCTRFTTKSCLKDRKDSIRFQEVGKILKRGRLENYRDNFLLGSRDILTLSSQSKISS